MWTRAAYNPARELGDTPAAATCPTRSLWWLVLAAAAGGAAGFYAVKKPKKKGSR